MLFCAIVGNIVYAWLLVDKELAAAGVVADSLEAHVSGFGALLFYGFI